MVHQQVILCRKQLHQTQQLTQILEKNKLMPQEGVEEECREEAIKMMDLLQEVVPLPQRMDQGVIKLMRAQALPPIQMTVRIQKT